MTTPYVPTPITLWPGAQHPGERPEEITGIAPPLTIETIPHFAPPPPGAPPVATPEEEFAASERSETAAANRRLYDRLSEIAASIPGAVEQQLTGGIGEELRAGLPTVRQHARELAPDLYDRLSAIASTVTTEIPEAARATVAGAVEPQITGGIGEELRGGLPTARAYVRSFAPEAYDQIAAAAKNLAAAAPEAVRETIAPFAAGAIKSLGTFPRNIARPFAPDLAASYDADLRRTVDEIRGTAAPVGFWGNMMETAGGIVGILPAFEAQMVAGIANATLDTSQAILDLDRPGVSFEDKMYGIGRAFNEHFVPQLENYFVYRYGGATGTYMTGKLAPYFKTAIQQQLAQRTLHGAGFMAVDAVLQLVDYLKRGDSFNLGRSGGSFLAGFGLGYSPEELRMANEHAAAEAAARRADLGLVPGGAPPGGAPSFRPFESRVPRYDNEGLLIEPGAVAPEPIPFRPYRPQVPQFGNVPERSAEARYQVGEGTTGWTPEERDEIRRAEEHAARAAAAPEAETWDPARLPPFESPLAARRQVIEAEARSAEMAGHPERARLWREEHGAAWTDSLTDLPNKGAFDLEANARTAARRPTAAAVLDIDFFSGINDTLGHDMGNFVLRRFADHARAAGLRIFRTGGEEFTVLGDDAADMLDRIERMRASVRADRELNTLVFKASKGDRAGQTVRGIDFSAGVVSSTNPKAALKIADKALYNAKESRGTTAEWDPTKTAKAYAEVVRNEANERIQRLGNPSNIRRNQAPESEVAGLDRGLGSERVARLYDLQRDTVARGVGEARAGGSGGGGEAPPEGRAGEQPREVNLPPGVGPEIYYQTSGTPRGRAFEVSLPELDSAIPTASWRETERGVFVGDLPNGARLIVESGRDFIEIVPAGFEAEYGREPTAAELRRGARGAMIPIGRDAIIQLTGAADVTTIPEEVWHYFARSTMNAAERRWLDRNFESEKAEADAYVEWLREQRPIETRADRLFARLWGIFDRIAGALGWKRPGSVFERVRTGEAFRRPTAARSEFPGEIAFQAREEPEPQPTFYSKLERVLEEKAPERVSEQQLMRILESGGVRRDEIAWIGLDRLFRDRKVVNKSEALDFARNNNVEVREVLKSTPGLNEKERDELEMLRGKNSSGERLTADEWRRIEQLEDREAYGGETKFHEYTLPGGRNYRELLLTLPAPAWWYPGRRDFPSAEATSQMYRSPHFEEPNVLAHVRFNERTDADGKRVLFIEEVQSDWHQAGRRKGYAPTAAEAAGGRVPNAPFAKTWHELVMKRMLRWAAEHGFDRIAWTTGEQQADRYDLAHYVDSVFAARNANGTFTVDAIQGGRVVAGDTFKEIAGVERLVGKDLAAKIATLAPGKEKDFRGVDLKIGGEGMAAFYDQILPRFLNAYAKKWGARVGTTELNVSGITDRNEARRVVNENYGNPAFMERNFPIVHSIDITPAMRESVMAGQPRFQIGEEEEGRGDRRAEERRGRSPEERPPIAPENVIPLPTHEDADRPRYDREFIAGAADRAGAPAAAEAAPELPREKRGGIRPPVIDFRNWKDAPAFFLARDTMERNLFKVAPEADRRAVERFMTRPIEENETARVKWINSERREVRTEMARLGIRAGSRDDELVMQYGEGSINIDELRAATPRWRQVEDAARFFRDKYDRALDTINTVHRRFGFKDVPKKESYFRHFQFIGNIAQQFGEFLAQEDLPTEIAGITEHFSPEKPWSSVELRRRGIQTTISAVRGYDNYLDAVSRQIFHTDSIQRIKALEQYIRDSAERAGKVAGSAPVNLPNFVSNTMRYWHLLAGKKHDMDRGMENTFGRRTYQAMNFLRGRVSANLVGANLSSALANFIPFTQSLAATEPGAAARGILSGIQSAIEAHPAMIDGRESGFLVRRFPERYIDPTRIQRASDMANWAFEAIDKFAARSIVAGKYYEAMDRGADPQQAMAIADRFAKRVMADRSAGQLPNIFSAKFFQLFEPFQVEVNNLFSFMKQDIPRMAAADIEQQGRAATPEAVMRRSAGIYLRLFAYSWLANWAYGHVLGRRLTFDPLQAILRTAGYSGVESEDKRRAGERAWRAAWELAENVPFVSLPLGGGRFPVSGVLPDVAKLKEEPLKELEQKLPSTALAIAPPFGGAQIGKTYRGLRDVFRGYAETEGGKTKYTITPTIATLVRAAAFGPSAVPEAQEYRESGGRPKKTRKARP